MRHHYFRMPNELLLDLDTQEQAFQCLSEIVLIPGVVQFKLVNSLTPGHKHAFIKLNRDVNNQHATRLSVRLGSCPKRAQADLQRAKAGATKPSLLIRHGRVLGDWRAPDWSCDCPNYQRGEKLRSCYHLRQFEPFMFHYGTVLGAEMMKIVNRIERSRP
jgi:hypothetical protein